MSLTVITRLLLLAVFLSLELASLVYAGDPPPAERDTPQGERNYAVARVIQDYKNPYSFAQLEPAPFTIPKGYVATAFNYRWVDPKTDRKNEKLTTTTIYSITEQRYLTEVKNNPDFILKAGEYKAVCGGMAGATGVLGYTLIREDLVKKTEDVVKTTPKDKATNRDDAIVKAKPPALETPPEKASPTELTRDNEKTGEEFLYRGVWLPEKYFPSGFRLYPDEKVPSGDPALGNSSLTVWYPISLQSKGGRPSTSSGDQPYCVFIDGIFVFNSTATAKKYFMLWKENTVTKLSSVSLGDEAYAENEWYRKEFSSQNGKLFRRDLNIRNIRVGRAIFGLRIVGYEVQDFNPQVPNSRRFIAHEIPTRDDLQRVAESFVGSIRNYANDKGWLGD